MFVHSAHGGKARRAFGHSRRDCGHPFGWRIQRRAREGPSRKRKATRHRSRRGGGWGRGRSAPGDQRGRIEGWGWICGRATLSCADLARGHGRTDDDRRRCAPSRVLCARKRASFSLDFSGEKRCRRWFVVSRPSKAWTGHSIFVLDRERWIEGRAIPPKQSLDGALHFCAGSREVDRGLHVLSRPSKAWTGHSIFCAGSREVDRGS